MYISASSSKNPETSEDSKNILKLPLEIEPITIIPLGYPDETPEPETIKPLREVVFYEHFNNK